MATCIGVMAKAGDGPVREWPLAMRMTFGTRDAAATGFKRKTNGDSAISMETSTGGMAMAGDGTTGACTVRKAASTIIAPQAIIEPTRSSSNRKDIRKLV